ncbi:Ectomycorrhiza-regulated small secreted protein [Mycena kentingensis (nom. inval.)]|nr:Ectomycorrhiza-regulated small secreted protein [Mycena kentingensis (nom. inval.)]
MLRLRFAFARISKLLRIRSRSRIWNPGLSPSRCAMTTAEPVLHHLLAYTLTDPDTTCPLLWDTRNAPRVAAHHVSAPTRPLSDFELSQHATNPPTNVIRVTCGLYSNAWVSETRNWLGVTVKNVLDAIYVTLQTQITHAEWEALCEKQQNRVNIVFDARWRAADEPQSVRGRGILRSDCLLQHVGFAGLSKSPNSGAEDNTYFMTLKRPKR